MEGASEVIQRLLAFIKVRTLLLMAKVAMVVVMMMMSAIIMTMIKLKYMHCKDTMATSSR